MSRYRPLLSMYYGIPPVVGQIRVDHAAIGSAARHYGITTSTHLQAPGRAREEYLDLRTVASPRCLDSIPNTPRGTTTRVSPTDEQSQYQERTTSKTKIL